MNIAIVPGYGDRLGYLERLTRNWPDRFGSQVSIVPFGWSGEAASFDEKDQKFLDTIQAMGEVGIVGISAGASAALRAKQAFLGQVTRVVTICGPVHLQHMKREKLHDKYPLLERSLELLSLDSLPAEDILTLRPLFDEVALVRAMAIDGAIDIRMKMVGHAASIAWGMYHHAADINDFLKG